jgi:hypothetical protein
MMDHHPARPGSVRADRLPPLEPMTAEAARRIMRAAERCEAVDALGIRILDVMLFGLDGWRKGACTHAIDAIARRAKVSRATVVRRLRVLCSEAVGLVERTRRAVLVDAAAGWRGAARWAQATTLYRFRLPAVPAGGPAAVFAGDASQAPPRPARACPAVPARATTSPAVTVPSSGNSEALREPPSTESESSPLPPARGWRAALEARARHDAAALERALARLGARVAERAVEADTAAEGRAKLAESARHIDGKIRHVSNALRTGHSVPASRCSRPCEQWESTPCIAI